jgi:hypothetical protein
MSGEPETNRDQESEGAFYTGLDVLSAPASR